MIPILCVDVGSTFTKAVLADADSGELLATAAHPTTSPDVMTGLLAVRSSLPTEPADVLVCSSAGGGLRLAVVGYERLVTAEAGRRVALSAGGRVVHLAAGPLGPAGIAALRAARPDLVVLTGGTDGGNADVLRHNAHRLATARIAAPVVLAGNARAAAEAAAELLARGRTVTVTPNLLPRIGVLEPGPARAAIRSAFLTHVIGGKRLSRGSSKLAGRTFAQLVKAPTPDAVLTGVGLLASSADATDVLLVDVGGATTDVYSVLAPDREEPTPRRPVVDRLLHARTVEGDLGMRWGAPGVVSAAVEEGLLVGARADELAGYAARVAADPGFLPARPDDDLALAGLAALVATRRHARPERPGADPRPLRDVTLLIGSGGTLRHAPDPARRAVLDPLRRDYAGGWSVPDRAGLAVDAHYTLFAAGLLADDHPVAAAALARAGLALLG